ncbi:MAG: methionine--tRNA ligase subunit beta, partial [Burkholderiales bacterium]|nr:methionine--tRNA ligase subunit beta [Burkholderiales bacterium]
MEDIDLNLDDFVARVNSDLVGKYVNIASRAAGFIQKNFNGKLKFHSPTDDLVKGAIGSMFHCAEHYDAREYAKAVRIAMDTADRINQHFDKAKPWVLAKDLAKQDELQDLCSRVLHGFQLLTVVLAPVLPATASRVAREFFGLDRDFVWSDGATLPTSVRPYQHLMTRIDAKQVEALVDANKESLKPAAESHSPQRHAQHQEKVVTESTQPAATAAAPATPTISIDEFMKVDLRVAKVVDAQHVEGAEKLVKLILDIGTEQRQVFAGIKAHYEPEQLKGRMVVMVANLAPRKMRFGESQGMVLAASNEGSGVFLLDLDSGAQPGMRVK